MLYQQEGFCSYEITKAPNEEAGLEVHPAEDESLFLLQENGLAPAFVNSVG